MSFHGIFIVQYFQSFPHLLVNPLLVLVTKDCHTLQVRLLLILFFYHLRYTFLKTM